MLSIGKVGGGEGNPRYYIDTVAKGAEDYYSGAGEAPGKWTGTAAAAQGLTGTVEDEQFLGQLTSHTSEGKKVLAYDLTFSAPKSVSVLYGIGDFETSRLARDAHDYAVEEAVGYVERHACWTRRGRAGRERVQGDGLTVAAFRHRTSRAGDPQLHTHAVVANATSARGKTTALDGRALYAHARTAGYLYQAVLREQLTRNLGVDWEPVHNGMAEIDGVPEDLRKHFSQRRQEILERLAQRGHRSSHAARLATLETRRTKEYDVPSDRLREDWRSRASEMGFGRAELEAMLDRRAPGRPVAPDAATVAGDLAAPGGLTREASTFDRRAVLRDWAAAHREGAGVSEIERLADAWLDSNHAIRLERGDHRPHLGGARYSTVEMLELEHHLLERAEARRDDGVAVVDPGVIDATLGAEPGLSAEQAELVRQVTSSGAGVQVVRAAAGTGKTRALHVARSAWETDGARVFGCALAARAAVEMEALAGIDSTTIAQLLHDIDRGYGLERGSVLVVDEGGMVGSRAIARLADHAAETDSKLVLVGDDRQLPELDAGGAFRGLAERLGAVELHEVRRQIHDWDREALGQLRRGRVGAWTDAYRDHGRLIARPSASEVRQALVDDWWEAARLQDHDAVMIAHRRVDVAELNALARDRMHRDGRLGEDEVAVGGRAFAAGDHVVARRNDRRAGIINGTRAEVVEVDVERRSLRLKIDEANSVEIESSYLEDGWLDHGYALTAHAAQGATVDRSFVLGSDELYREWGYNALSRHRDEARFYVVSPSSVERALPGLEPETDPVTSSVKAMLGPSRRKTLATDLLDKEGKTRLWAQLADRDMQRHETEDRIARLTSERESLTFWQRAQRAEIDDMLERQRDALERLTRTEPVALQLAEAYPPTDQPAADRLDVREALNEPSSGISSTIGLRPPGFREREVWCRAAAALVGQRTAPNVPTDLAPTMYDTGMEL